MKRDYLTETEFIDTLAAIGGIVVGLFFGLVVTFEWWWK